jgi:DNA polymerase III alpha subunit
LNSPGEHADESPVSIFDILIENKIEELFLLEDSFGGFLQAHQNCKENNIKLNFGLRFNFLCDVKEKNEEALKSRCKYSIFAKNNEGYKRLVKIWSLAAKEGFYYTPNLDFKVLRDFWNDDDLLMCVPFYDSFLHRNTLEGAVCIPDFEYCKPVLFLEDNDVPFDYLIRDRVEAYAKSSGLLTQEVKSIFYKGKKDFMAYLTFKCVNKRSTLDRPNMDHMCSDEFCFESWAKQKKLKVADDKPKKKVAVPKKEKDNVIVLTKEQQKYANQIGAKRQKYNESINKKDAYGFKGNGEKIHIQGARAELSVSLILKQDWTDFKKNYTSIMADVGKNIQVRSTNYREGNLLVHPKDKDDQVFVLVKSHNYPEMEISGWILGKDAKRKEFWEDGTNWPKFKGRACYRFPYERLNPITTLESLGVITKKAEGIGGTHA